MYDVAIVGARCAGSALALMLAREGLSVVVIDRTTFPSDTMSGHFIQPAGVSCLRRLGLIVRSSLDRCGGEQRCPGDAARPDERTERECYLTPYWVSNEL
jgi:2-polyprenyl-6-methoxyphenol hydroxylase-like FAD-dependent oxidoreductase